MTPPHIIKKLEAVLQNGITTEAEAVYLMVGVRKLLEQQQLRKKYEYLAFYCDWALHTFLSGPTAQKILKVFDVANVELQTSSQDLPLELGEIDSISRMTPFRDELYQFLQSNGLPLLRRNHGDGWIYFLHLYARIVEDCPLVMADTKTASIASVTLTVEVREQPFENQSWFKVRWTLLDKTGQSGELYVVNSFYVGDVL